MPAEVRPKGKQFILTEAGEAVSVRPLLDTHLLLPNGERVQVKRVWTETAIATGADEAELIPAPADEQHYLVVLGYTVMCDADTLVSFSSNAGVVGMPLPCAAKGGITRVPTGLALLVGVPGESIDITTSGGNTYLDMHYAEVPIDVDIL